MVRGNSSRRFCYGICILQNLMYLSTSFLVLSGAPVQGSCVRCPLQE
jgi:hypothetical protein